jgi:5-methyltetrahydropteroyltriglutamate--homocysteine methyltransferase
VVEHAALRRASSVHGVDRVAPCLADCRDRTGSDVEVVCGRSRREIAGVAGVTGTYRADVVGSLLRPRYLSDARTARDRGELTQAQFKQIEDRAVDQVIAMQERAGLEVVTDGELRRAFFFDHLISAVDGVGEATTGRQITWHGDDPDDDVSFRPPYAVTDTIRRRTMLTAEEFCYARAQARRPVKVSVPSPLLFFYLWSERESRDAYPDPWELCAAGVELVREEVRELARLGCRYVQVDAPELGDFVDDEQRARWESLGIPAARVLTEGMDMINAAVDVSGVHRGLHVCRGNYASRWISRGGYGAIADALFSRASNFETLLLEYDDERSGTFSPLRDAPADKTIVLGLISTKRERLESPDEIVARISEASTFIPLEQLAVSTQCGFASSAEGNLISETAQEGKLRLVAEVARRVWGEG